MCLFCVSRVLCGDEKGCCRDRREKARPDSLPHRVWSLCLLSLGRVERCLACRIAVLIVALRGRVCVLRERGLCVCLGLCARL